MAARWWRWRGRRRWRRAGPPQQNGALPRLSGRVMGWGHYVQTSRSSADRRQYPLGGRRMAGMVEVQAVVPVAAMVVAVRVAAMAVVVALEEMLAVAVTVAAMAVLGLPDTVAGGSSASSPLRLPASPLPLPASPLPPRRAPRRSRWRLAAAAFCIA